MKNTLKLVAAVALIFSFTEVVNAQQKPQSTGDIDINKVMKQAGAAVEAGRFGRKCSEWIAIRNDAAGAEEIDAIIRVYAIGVLETTAGLKTFDESVDFYTKSESTVVTVQGTMVALCTTFPDESIREAARAVAASIVAKTKPTTKPAVKK